MPRIISYTPAWLSRPSPGFDLFSSGSNASASPATNGTSPQEVDGIDDEEPYVGPQRTIARRGTEIFVAVGKQLRWSDLCMLKDDWEEKEKKQQSQGKGRDAESEEEGSEDASERSYRILKVPVGRPIRQLIISPRGDLLAIVTSHTVHIAILPDPSHLGQPDTGPLKLKTDMLGPTTHVTAQAPIASALWHPLGVSGMCLVTVTTDAVVRVWEINRENRWSFESPTLAIDLGKLADGVSADEDFGPPKPDMNRGFSPDSVDMEVAAACFGGSGLDEEHGWASMTLWIAMRAGDVYALCPLLPTKWQPTPTLIPSLSTSVVSKTASMQDDVSISAEDRRNCDQQYQWFSEIDNQDPIVKPADSEFNPPVEIFKRPSQPRPIPQLQGPFEIEIDESGDDIELTDIYVIGAKVDDDELVPFYEDESEVGDLGQSGLSLAVVNLLTKGGRVHVCLDVDGVGGQWLPNKKVGLAVSDYRYLSLSDGLLVSQDKSIRHQDADPGPSLVVLESIDTMRAADHSDTSWPMFSADVQSRYAFFVAHPQGVSYLSLSQWTERLEGELNSSASTGAAFRIEVVTEGSRTLREQLFYLGNGGRNEDLQRGSFVGCIVLQDSDLGYFLLTAAGEQPYAITFDLPDSELPHDVDGLYEPEYEPDMKMLAIGPPRAAYQPPASLWSQSALSNFLDARVHSRHKKTLKEEIRLSAATLDLMTEAHRILSHETHQLGIAAADLFRRCERLQHEFRDQIKRANDLADRIEQVAGDDADDYDERNQDAPRGSAALEKRLEAARTRQDELVQRHADLRTRLAKSCGRELSDKEQIWIWEINKLEASVFDRAKKRDQDDANGTLHKPTEPWRRYEEVKDLTEELVAQANHAAEDHHSDANGVVKVPPELRKAKVTQVIGLLERESALVHATLSRLERLNLASSLS